MPDLPIIGPAGRLALTLPHRLGLIVKLLFAGPPGVGKTILADRIALHLCGGRWAVETVNGRNVSIHLVREWMNDIGTSSLFGTGWKAKIVNEVDVMPRDAQDALLSFLDDLPPRRAFIATSNLDIDQLTERFRTRLQRFEVGAPDTHEIASLLLTQQVPDAVAQHIAGLSGGNVRAALLDADAWRSQQGGAELAALAQQFELSYHA